MTPWRWLPRPSIPASSKRSSVSCSSAGRTISGARSSASTFSSTRSRKSPTRERMPASATQRQPAKRVFAEELNMATHSFTRPEDEGDDRAPKFTLLPSGEAVNRVLVVGALIETSDVGDDSEFWKGRVMAGGEVVNIYAGQYQQEPMAVLRSTETPSFVAVVGKVHQYETDAGVNVSIQPEHISTVGGEIRDSWMAETINATRARLGALESGESEIGRASCRERVCQYV